MDYELPVEFDVIIVGTGIVESVVSAAASRIGKRVLHVDINNYYGGQWASFNLDAIQNLSFTQSKMVSSFLEIRKENEVVFPFGNDSFNLKDFKVQWFIPKNFNEAVTKGEINETIEHDQIKEKEDDSQQKIKTWTQESLLKDSRKFNIDLTPKLQFARGNFVELLISSNIARYSEYRSVSRVLTWQNNQLEVVPCSRSDVFANNKVSVIEKRMLMKFFTSLDNYEQEISENETETFLSFLKKRKLSQNLIHYMLYAIAMSTHETSCLQGIQNCKRFLNSLGRFGKTPFLFSMYGSGEITQAFCRLSAVFGGIYALNQPLNGIIIENNNFKGIICGKQKIAASYLIMGSEKSPEEFISEKPRSYISRAIFITDRSVMESEKEHLTLLLYPPTSGKNAITIIEMGSLTGTCPKNLYLVHLTSKQSYDPETDFQDCIKNLFSTSEEDLKPKILWACYFSIPDSNELDLNVKTPQNVFVCPGPDLDLDYDCSINKAKEIFLSLYPTMEFLPRAPDPEEIIIEGEETEIKAIEVSNPENETNKQ